MPSNNTFNEIKAVYKPTPDAFRKAGEKTHGKGRHKPHKVGDRITFKTPNGRTSGKVVEAHKEFYIVDNKGHLYKVNRNSILYALGSFAGRAVQKYNNIKNTIELGKEVKDEEIARIKQNVRTIRKRANESVQSGKDIEKAKFDKFKADVRNRRKK